MLRLSLAVAVLMVATVAHAQDPQPNPQMQAQRGHMREVCGGDIEKFCAGAGEDRHARRECMQANQSKFSKPCQDMMSEMEARRAAHQDDHPHDPGQGPQ